VDSARWESIQSLFHRAAELPPAAQRDFLEAACGGDLSLVEEVLAMLQSDARHASVLDTNMARAAGDLVDGALPAAVIQQTFGAYRLARVLGEGGMGVVYLGTRHDLGSVAAIKILRDASLSPVRRERFDREQRILAQLNHPAIARLYDAGVLDDGTPWFAMEYVEGVPITEHCRRQNATLAQRLRLFRDVCEAVLHAHRLMVVHRDLKPSNILVRDDGSVKLLDFGISKQLDTLNDPAHATVTGQRLMTPAYAAPEQVRGAETGVQTDVYALGVVLYELLSGRTPFDLAGLAPGEAERLLLEVEPSKPSARAAADTRTGLKVGRREWADLDVLCLTAMQKDPARRYGSVKALARDVDHYLNGEPLEARPDSVGYRAGKFVHRRWRAVSAAAAALALATATVTFYTLRLTDARSAAQAERDRANRQTAIATAVNRFLAEDLLGRSDPFRSGNSSTTLADAVKRAIPDIDRQFHDAPAVGARLHQAVARALDNRSEFAPARQEYDRAAALFVRSEGPQSKDTITVQLQRAAMEARTYEAESLQRAKSILAEQESHISRLPRVDDDLAVWLASARGMVALIGNDAKEAARQFQIAYAGATRLSTFDENTRLMLQQRLAFAHIRLGDGGEAERLFRELIAAFSRLEGADTPSVLRVRLNLAQALMIQNKHREAIAETTAIYPAYVARLGADHELAMQVLTTRAQSEGSLGLWDDAIRDDLEVYALAVRKQGPLSFFALATLSDAALAQCRAGRIRDGAANAKRAYDLSGKAFGARAGLTGGTAYTLAVCLIGSSELDAASNLLSGIDTKAVAQLSGSPEADWSANIDLARAEISYRRGDVEAARKLLEPIVSVLSRADAEPYQRHAVEKLSAAIRSAKGASQ